MNHSLALAGLFGLSIFAASGGAGAQTPIACALLSEKEASALMGGAVVEIDKGESKPTPQNDHTHTSWCTFYPKEFDKRKASGPPERGLTLELRGKRSSADAKRMMDMLEGDAKRPGSPLEGVKLSPLSGMGQAAMMEVNDVHYFVTIYFLKGSVYGIINVNKDAATADERVEIARAAAKQVIAKLP